MAKKNLPSTATVDHSTGEKTDSPLTTVPRRRSFLKGLGIVGAAVSAGPGRRVAYSDVIASYRCLVGLTAVVLPGGSLYAAR